LRPDRLVLAIDTSAAHCAAALLCGDRVAVRVEEMAKGQAERLVPMVTDLLDAEGFSMADVGLVAVGVGPGNFTGIRIAVALARGLALGLGVPAIGVTGFDAARTEGAEWVVLPAPRGQVYAQRFLPEPEAALILEPGEVVGRIAHLADMPVADFVVAIGRLALARAGVAQPRPAPFYLRGADAAPASDPPPVMLP
jgi:tRNA threonylcarbamoyladenosine biosynthesis protein TsaB